MEWGTGEMDDFWAADDEARYGTERTERETLKHGNRRLEEILRRNSWVKWNAKTRKGVGLLTQNRLPLEHAIRESILLMMRLSSKARRLRMNLADIIRTRKKKGRLADSERIAGEGKERSAPRQHFREERREGRQDRRAVFEVGMDDGRVDSETSQRVHTIAALGGGLDNTDSRLNFLKALVDIRSPLHILVEVHSQIWHHWFPRD